jgi:hypothetical protein
MLPLVNAIVTLLHCVYLKQSLHHILLDLCKYLMIQSSLWQMVRTRSSKDVYDDVHEFSTRRRGTFHPNVPPPSPPTPPVSLEQLLTPLNAIVQKLAAIDECQAGQSQPYQQSQESYFDFLATQPPEFAEVTDPLEANNWLRVTESKFGLLHCTELQKTLLQHSSFVGWQVCGGTLTLPHYLRIIRFHGMNSAQPSVLNFYLRVCSATR